MSLCKMALWLSGEVVTLCLDNSTAEAHICNQGDTESTFYFQTSLPHF